MTKAKKRLANKLHMRRKRAGLITRGYMRRGMTGWDNLFKPVRAVKWKRELV